MKQLGRLQAVNLRKAWTSEPQGFTLWLANKRKSRSTRRSTGIQHLGFEVQERMSGLVLIENQLEPTGHTQG